jgi:hypothetical protein
MKKPGGEPGDESQMKKGMGQISSFPDITTHSPRRSDSNNRY